MTPGLPEDCGRGVAAWLLVLALCACGQRSASQAGKRPSVLIVVADDLAHAALERGQTPALDRLASESVTFRHATASSPFCTPSRQSFLTGRWPHAIGVTQVNSLLPTGLTTLGDVFRRAGYATAAFGKMHWQRRRSGGADRGFDGIADVQEWREQLTSDERAAYEAHRELWRERGEAGWSHLNLEGEPVPLPEERQYAAWLVNRTLAFIDERRGQPYLAFCSFAEVHAPFAFPPSYAGRVRPEDVELPADDVDSLQGSAPGVLATLRAREKTRGPLTRDARRRAVASYLTSAAWLDSQVGRLLDGLEARDPSGQTIVVFWSDHGFHLGEHGLMSKSVPFREVLEAPLFIRAPGATPGGRTALVQMLDVFPTLCELAGVRTPEGLDGRSLVPALGGDVAVREYAFSEFVGLWAALRDERWKLVLGREAGAGFDQLYDLTADPGETRNLVGDARHDAVKRELAGRMEELLRASPPDWMAFEDWMGDARGPAAVRRAIAHIE